MEKSHKKEIDQLILKLNKSLEVIDLMAKYIDDCEDNTLCKNVEKCYRKDEDCEYFPCQECIKEYYFNKVKGNAK